MEGKCSRLRYGRIKNYIEKYKDRSDFMARVAVATTDGTAINEHFGRAKEFIVYEVSGDGTYTQVKKISTGEGGEEDKHEALDTTVNLLEGVEIVLAAQIGPKAIRALQDKGIIGFGIVGSIDSALKSYAKRSKLVKNITTNTVKCYPSSGCDCSSGGCR